uniref:Amyloid beta A4 precursor protein-binding family B member 2-like n=1 Tax=Sinocyclocheilus anshuiensis TaxID=1608454 RepID=A0A671M8E1_9TELE
MSHFIPHRLCVILTAFSLFLTLAMMSVCVPSPCNPSPSVDIANHNGPSATPPTSLSLLSSHNQLLSGDVIKQGQATPPKCRKKYALTSIQSAMGLGEGMIPPSSSSATTANPKLAKNGANQLRKAAERQDHNKNTTEEDEDGNTAGESELNIDDELRNVEDLSLDSESNVDDVHSDFDPNNELVDEEVNELIDEDTNEEDLVENCDDLLILSEKTEIVSDRKSPEHLKTKSCLESKPHSPEDTPLLSVGSSSSSSSPETKKDRPRTGAKTDRALNRIQNLPHSDEESSWTTLSQDSASLGSPEESDIWGEQSFQTDPDLPPGWKMMTDMAGIYYWHIPTGTTQWERPAPCHPVPTGPSHASRKHSLGSLSPSPTPDHEKQPWSDFAVGKIDSEIWKDLQAATVNPDPSLKEFEGATLRYASLKLRNPAPVEEEDSSSINSDPEAKCFAVRSLGWVEMAEEDLAPGKSSVAVNNCIRQLSYCKNDIRDTVGIWGEGKDMYLILENNMLNLVDPMDRSVLHSQPIASIRVWGVGRDNGRDFAYVARDKDTRILKCHVFRCDTPAKAIATSLHEICSRIMAERKNAKAMAGGSLQDRTHAGLDVPLQAEFPTPKTELVQKFQVLYVGMMPVARPIGMDILNGAIDSLITSSIRDDWVPVMLNVADATVTVIKEKEEEEVLVECRVRFLSFMGVGKNVHSFAFIMDSGNQHFECHVFWCDPNAGSVSEAVQAACVLRYHKCLVARPPSQKACSQAPPADSVTRRVSTSVKRGVLSLIDTLKQKRPVTELPQ